MKKGTGYIPLLSVLVLLILGSLCFIIFDREPEAQKLGITLEAADTSLPAEQTVKRGRELIKKTVRVALAKEDLSEEQLESTAERLLSITLSEGLSDTKYSAFSDVLSDTGEPFAEAIAELSSGRLTDLGAERLFRTFFAFSSAVGVDFVGSVAYEVIMFGYERRIERHLSEGDALGAVLARELQAKRDILESSVGKSEFPKLLSLGSFLRGFFSGEGLDSETLSRFTDSEILIFLNEIDFSDLDIKKEGYMLLADYYSDSLVNKDTSYFDELFYKANYNGDMEKLASRMPELLSLLSAVKSSLSPSDIRLLREGDQPELCRSVFEKFGEEEWASFAALTDTDIRAGDYDALAEKLFGEDFLRYISEGEKKELSELRAAVSDKDFYKTLEGYIFGISPAFSYGMRR